MYLFSNKDVDRTKDAPNEMMPELNQVEDEIDKEEKLGGEAVPQDQTWTDEVSQFR